MPNENPGPEPGQTLKADAAGLTLLPSGMGEGEAPLPFAVTASVGVSQPDATGKVYALLTISDATLTVTIRMPWENAGQFGMGLAQGLAAIQQKAEGMAHKGLALPNGGQPNRLILPGTVAR